MKDTTSAWNISVLNIIKVLQTLTVPKISCNKIVKIIYSTKVHFYFLEI